MNRFLVVNFNFGAKIKMAELEPVFTAIGDDWVRISPLCWILWTGKPAMHVYTIIVGHMTPDDSLLITPIPDFVSNNFFAFLPTWVWDWLASKNELGGPSFLIGDDNEEYKKLPRPR